MDNMHKNIHRRAHGQLWVVHLNEQKVEELLYLLVFVWSPKRERRPQVTAADAGFVEGGFCYIIARKACAKFWEPRPLLAKPRLFSIVVRGTACPTSPIDLFLIGYSAEAY